MVRKADEWVIRWSHWLQLLAIVVLALIPASAMLGRYAPFVVYPPAEPLVIHAGQPSNIDVPVYRDIERKCDTRYDRQLIDSRGVRSVLLMDALMTWELRQKIEAESPGRMSIAFDVPRLRQDGNGGVTPGRGTLEIDMRHYCHKGHYIPWWTPTSRASIPVFIEP